MMASAQYLSTMFAFSSPSSYAREIPEHLQTQNIFVRSVRTAVNRTCGNVGRGTHTDTEYLCCTADNWFCERLTGKYRNSFDALKTFVNPAFRPVLSYINF